MKTLTARWIYCAGLCFIAACAVLPEVPVLAPPAIVAGAPPTPEQQLAHAMRDRIEAERRYDANHPAIAEATLRDLALSANPQHFHRDFVRALTNELSDALADRTEASLKYDAKHPEMQKAEAAVSGLTAAINVEVRQHDA